MEVLEFALSQHEEACAPGSSPSTAVDSCSEIFKHTHNETEDGEFWIKNSDGQPTQVYCAYNPIPNANERGMLRIGYLDMTDSEQYCPPQFREVTKSSKRLCARNMKTGGCNSVTFSSKNIPYKKICGRVKAYHYGSPSGFYTPRVSGYDINAPYLEGVSITRGTPRKHVWSFANALAENIPNTDHLCPCMNPTQNQQRFIPDFVGQDYFCDAGSHTYPPVGVLYPNDPLWDGQGCQAPSTCCTFNNPPWFCKELGQETTDGIELRLCADEDAFVNEDSPIEQIEIYVY